MVRKGGGGEQGVTILPAKHFNVVGDGEQHNTLELIALRDHIRAGPDTVWLVEFEPGHYHYTDNRWLHFGNRTVILEFNGSKVECGADAILQKQEQLALANSPLFVIQKDRQALADMTHALGTKDDERYFPAIDDDKMGRDRPAARAAAAAGGGSGPAGGRAGQAAGASAGQNRDRAGASAPRGGSQAA